MVWSSVDSAANSGMDLAKRTALSSQSDTRALTGNKFFLASCTRVLPVTRAGAVEVDEQDEWSEAGESHPRVLARGSRGDDGEARLGVEELRPLDDDDVWWWCLPTLRRFLSKENSSPPCWPSPGLGGKLCIDGEAVDGEDEEELRYSADRAREVLLNLAGREEDRDEGDPGWLEATSRNADTAVLFRGARVVLTELPAEDLQLRSMGSVCMSESCDSWECGRDWGRGL